MLLPALLPLLELNVYECGYHGAHYSQNKTLVNR